MREIPELNIGDVIVAKRVEQRSPDGDLRFGYAAKRNREFVGMLVGNIEKKSELTVDMAKNALLDLGFVPVEELEKLISKTAFAKVLKHFDFAKS